MKAKDMAVGRMYESTAFKRPVKLVSIDRIYEDGNANVTVLYCGKLYTDCTFRMKEKEL